MARLAERSFLNLWSYPSPHRNQMVGRDGKEICDLLVVCGDHVLIFSEKTYSLANRGDRGGSGEMVSESNKEVCGPNPWSGALDFGVSG